MASFALGWVLYPRTHTCNPQMRDRNLEILGCALGYITLYIYRYKYNSDTRKESCETRGSFENAAKQRYEERKNRREEGVQGPAQAQAQAQAQSSFLLKVLLSSDMAPSGAAPKGICEAAAAAVSISSLIILMTFVYLYLIQYHIRIIPQERERESTYITLLLAAVRERLYYV